MLRKNIDEKTVIEVTKITDQESNTWTSRLFEELRREKYNIIFEGTMKNNRIADESITELKKLGYTVVVRGIAVCDLESRWKMIILQLATCSRSRLKNSRLVNRPPEVRPQNLTIGGRFSYGKI